MKFKNLFLQWTSSRSAHWFISKSARLISLTNPRPSDLLKPLAKLLIWLSELLVEFTVGFELAKIIGPLLFRKIDGERHFFPSS